MKKVIENITKVCCVWEWCLFKMKRFNKSGDYAFVSKTGKIGETLGVVVISIDKKRNIALIKNYRYAIDKMSWELVRGTHEVGLSSIEDAIREFKEEIGEVRFLSSKFLGSFSSDSGLIGGYIDFVLLESDDFSKYNVWGLKDGKYEDIYEVKYFSLKELENMILKGKIVDSFTLSAYGLLKLHKII